MRELPHWEFYILRESVPTLDSARFRSMREALEQWRVTSYHKRLESSRNKSTYQLLRSAFPRLLVWLCTYENWFSSMCAKSRRNICIYSLLRNDSWFFFYDKIFLSENVSNTFDITRNCYVKYKTDIDKCPKFLFDFVKAQKSKK